MPQKITELFAWVATEPDGSEGVCAHEVVIDGRRMIAPLVGADRARIQSYRGFADTIAETTGRPIRLMRFSNAETLERLG